MRVFICNKKFIGKRQHITDFQSISFIDSEGADTYENDSMLNKLLRAQASICNFPIPSSNEPGYSIGRS